jgi:hypothetical protein
MAGAAPPSAPAADPFLAHTWYHIGEIQAIRQQLGDKPLPGYVSNIEGKAPYRRERG